MYRRTHTEKCTVTACRTIYKVRKGGDFFYGKSATHKYKDSREQFEQRTHKRLIDIVTPTQKTVDALSRLEMPAGVYIDIKMKQK